MVGFAETRKPVFNRLRGRWLFLFAAVVFVAIVALLSTTPTSPKALIQNTITKWRNCPELPDRPEAPIPVEVASEDELDAFRNFNKGPGCNTTSQELHFSKKPVCKDRHTLLTAMSHGGRHGFDQPYGTLGCDMKWLSTAEICETLKQFDAIHILGDSLMRQLTVAMHIFMREDLVNGGRQTWRTDNPPDQDCRCRQIFAKGSKCFWWEAIATKAVLDHDPDSLKCARNVGQLIHGGFTAYPIPAKNLDGAGTNIADSYEEYGPRHAYVVGQGLWNANNATATELFLDQMEGEFRKKAPRYFVSPKLFITPSASGERKNDGFVETGNNIYMQRFIHKIEPVLQKKGYEHLGLYNMTVQATSPDGTHANLESTLLEAMAVFNWLHYLPTREEAEKMVPPHSSPDHSVSQDDVPESNVNGSDTTESNASDGSNGADESKAADESNPSDSSQTGSNK